MGFTTLQQADLKTRIILPTEIVELKTQERSSQVIQFKSFHLGDTIVGNRREGYPCEQIENPCPDSGSS